MIQKDLYKRIARMESMIDALKAEREEVLREAYKRACETQNEEDASVLARKIRNKLLDASDKEMSLDRLNLDTSSATKFIASLKTVFTNEWSKYRQALRDIPQQKGFPFNVEFPKPPDSEDTEDIIISDNL